MDINDKVISVYDENKNLILSALMVCGDRDEQQDFFGYLINDDFTIVSLCDGMGGHNRGDLASHSAVSTVLNHFKNCDFQESEIVNLQRSTKNANDSVYKLTDESGNKIGSGTTLVSVLIKNNELFWNSVGDSRAYFFRNGEFAQITMDQNYKTVLDEQYNAGVIDKNAYYEQLDRGSALISYLGMEEEPLIDFNSSPISLQKEDRILLMSDGLYKILSDKEIANIISNFSNTGDSLSALEIKCDKKAKENGISRDNTTMILIQMK